MSSSTRPAAALRLPPPVAEALRSRRIVACLTVEELAEAADVPAARVIALEACAPLPETGATALLADLRRLAQCLEVPPASLIGSTVAAWADAYAAEAAGFHADTRRVAAVPRVGPAALQAGDTGLLPVTPKTDDGRRRRRSRPATCTTDALETSPPASPKRERRTKSSVERILGRCAVVIAVGDLAAGGLLLAHESAASHGSNAVTAGSQAVAATSPTRPGRSTDRATAGARPDTHARPANLVSSAGAVATYRVPAARFGLSITVDRPTWLEVGPTGQAPTFAATVPAGTTERFAEGGPATLLVGAGGTAVTVRSGTATETLHPASAPFTYQFVPG